MFNPTKSLEIVSIVRLFSLLLSILASTSAMADTQLTNGVEVPVLVPGQDQYRYLFVDVPAGATRLVITMSGNSSADCNLFVRRSNKPVPPIYSHSNTAAGNNATITINGPNSPMPGQWWIGVLCAYSPPFPLSTFNGSVKIRATYTMAPAPSTPPQVWEYFYPGMISAGSYPLFKFVDVPAGKTLLKVKSSGRYGDLSLGWNFGSKPQVLAGGGLVGVDAVSQNAGTCSESITIPNPAVGRHWFVVFTSSSYTDLRLTITLQ